MKRMLTSALALLAAASVAKTAQATTAYSITNSGSKTITDTAGDWWGEDSKYGDFGAGYSAGYTLYSNYSGSDKYEKVEGAVSGELFGANFDFVDVSIKAHSGQSSTLYGDYYLGSFGATIVNLFNQNLSMPANSGLEIGIASFDSDGVSIEACVEAEADADMSFVGVPVVVTAGAAGCLGMNVSASATYNGTTKNSAINFTGEPSASVGLSLSAGVGSSVASAGGYAELTLIEASVPITNSLSVTPTSTASSNTSGTMQYATSGYLTLSSLAGEFGLYVKLGFIKYTYTLFDWDGVTWTNQLLFTDAIPVASSPSISIYGNTATGSYTYTDVNGESGSTIKWYRASSSSGSGSALVQSGSSKTFELSQSDDDKFLKLCVTPSNGVNAGTEVCTGWKSVGHVVTYYWDSNYSGYDVTVAYRRSQSGTCFNMEEVKAHWNDDASSYKFAATNACSTTLYMYKDADCSGSVTSRTLSAATSESVSSMSSTLGSSWNDSLSSIRVVYCDSVSASDVSVVFDKDMADGAYTLASTSLFTTDSSSFVWYRASDSSGTGSYPIAMSNDYELTAADEGKYLRFCVTPNDGTVSGSQVCSDWTRVTGVTFYWDSSYGGDSLTIAYEQAGSGTCYNLSEAEAYWNDDASSFVLYGPTTGSATLTMYKDADCSGSAIGASVSANSTKSVSSLSSTYGSGYNDSISSFKVTY